MLKKIAAILCTVVIFCGCNVVSDADLEVVEVSKEVTDFITARVTGMIQEDTFYNFRGVKQLNVDSLRGYLRGAWRDYPFAKDIIDEAEKQKKDVRLNYKQMSLIFQDEFGLDKLPFEAVRETSLYVNVGDAQDTGLSEIVSITQTGDIISVIATTKDYPEWYNMISTYDKDGVYYFMKWEEENHPYIIQKEEFIFKTKSHGMPILVEGKLLQE